MTDETNTHRRVMEKARAEIDRLTRELAVTRDDMRDCRTMLSVAEEERDAARQERDARPAITPEDAVEWVRHHEDDADYTAACGRVGLAISAHARLSPPSAPAQDKEIDPAITVALALARTCLGTPRVTAQNIDKENGHG